MTVAIATASGSAARSCVMHVGARARRRVAAVGEGVHHRRDAGAMQDLRQRDRVVLMRMHAARRHQAHQVAGAARRLQLADQLEERRRLGEAAVLDGVADARQFLHHHAAGADVQVADLGVAHLAVRQADIAARGVQECVRAALPQPVEVRLARLADGVVGGFLAPAEAVEDHQHHRPNRLRHGATPPASRGPA